MVEQEDDDFFAPVPMVEPEPEPVAMSVAEPAPVMMEEPVAAPVSVSSAEVISLETMRNAMIANFEQEDLDVPAFLRKRNEAM